MFCPNCGAEVNEGAFCPKCGTKIGEAPINNAQTVQTVDNQMSYVQSGVAQTQSPKSNKLGVIIGIAAAALIAIIAIAVIVKNHRTTVKIDDYVTVEFDGYDSLGNASVVMDWDALDEKYGEKIKIDKKALRTMIRRELSEELFGYNVSADYVEANLSDAMKLGGTGILKNYLNGEWDLSDYNNLNNGDEVTFTWDLDEEDINELESILKCRLKYDDELKFTVVGLEQIGTFDPFANVDVVYSGMAPDGTAWIDYDSSDYGYYLNYTLDKTKGLSNGDTVTVSVRISGSENSFVDAYGKLPYPTEKTYTVDGLMAYISTAEDIPDQLLVDMQKQAEDVIKANIAQNWDEAVSLKALTYLGNYFLNRKGGSSGDINRCALVYKITATMNMIDAETEQQVALDQDIYYYVTFANLMIEEDGSGAVDISNYHTTSDKFKIETDILKSTGWWDYYYWFNFYGYDSLDKLYNEVVTKNIEKYNHEDNVVE